VNLRIDSDDIVRRYTRFCRADQGYVPSFTQAVLAQVTGRKAPPTNEHDSEEVLIDFRGGSTATSRFNPDVNGVLSESTPANAFRFNLDVHTVLSESAGEGWVADGPLKDKIVLLGGDYAVQDEHRTPLGWMLGVEVLAQTMETELRGSGIAAPSELFLATLMAIDSLVLFFLISKRSLKSSIVISLISVPLLAVLSSWLAVRSLTLSFYFVTILLVLLGLQIYERLKGSSVTSPAQPV
jgi:CHASE2 domain-containing sensor protein